MCHKGEAKKRRLLTVRVLQQKGTGSPYSSSDAIFFFFSTCSLQMTVKVPCILIWGYRAILVSP